jgi:hypothetical protein
MLVSGHLHVRLQMDTLPLGLRLEIVWYDEHMLRFQLSASNGNFSAQTSFYAALDAPQELANHIAGFPKSLAETREFEFGGQQLPGYGGLALRLSSEGNLGHLLVTLSACATPLEINRPIETSTFCLSTTPADIDTFTQALKRMECCVGAAATLRAAT